MMYLGESFSIFAIVFVFLLFLKKKNCTSLLWEATKRASYEEVKFSNEITGLGVWV